MFEYDEWDWTQLLELTDKEMAQRVPKADLLGAIRRLYYAAHWVPDRNVDAKKLWTDVRDAAGFEHGKSPVQKMSLASLDDGRRSDF